MGRVIASGIVCLLLGACDGTAETVPENTDAGTAAVGNPDFVASCVYTNTFANAEECVEYRGAGWNESSAARACSRVFLSARGDLTLDSPCFFESEVGRCVVGDLEADGYLIVSAGDASACGAAQTGCETFAGGTFTPSDACNSCAATGDEGPGAIVPREPDCRAARVGEPSGATAGEVCTPTLISGSTEPGRRFADYADCGVVRTQRPYYPMPNVVPSDDNDERLTDPAYMEELEWVREQAEASACACCHTSSDTPSGAAAWDTEAGPLWIDTVTDEALAMLAGFTDSAAFGFLPAEENNGFDRSETGLPTTDKDRLQAFAALELDRRGVSLEQARALPPFAPFFRDLIDFEPEACPEGVGVDADGAIRWSGGGARYLWVLRADATAPGVPPNWDLPEGTLWAIRADFEGSAFGCGMSYGELPQGAVQRIPETGAAPTLVPGETYFLDVQRDIGLPITRCLFVAP